MKKALKIGAKLVAIHYALNLVYAMGMATPIMMELLKRNYRTADMLSNLNRRNHEKCKYIAEITDDVAEFMANAILAITKDERRVKHDIKN